MHTPKDNQKRQATEKEKILKTKITTNGWYPEYIENSGKQEENSSIEKQPKDIKRQVKEEEI